MKIAVIFTGGTIGSRAGENGKIATRENPYILLELYREKYPEETFAFESFEPYEILSENLQGRYLEKLVKTVHHIEKTVCPDGIIVTHGTDTLQYAAAVLGLVFQEIAIPLVLVSSDFVLEDVRANGLSNFAHALEFIKRRDAGVYVSYENKGDCPRIHEGISLQPPKIYSADVESLGGCYGFFEDGKYRQMKEKKKLDFPEVDKENFRLIDGLVARIVPYAGMKYPGIPEGTKAVLHESYHSGTICVGEEFLRFATEMKVRGIPVFLTGLDTGEKEYETVEVYRRAGVKILSEGTVISWYCRLWILASML